MKSVYIALAVMILSLPAQPALAQRDVDSARLQNQQRDIERGRRSAPRTYTRSDEGRLQQQNQERRRTRSGVPKNYYQSERQRLTDQADDLDRGKASVTDSDVLYRRRREVQ
jgi:hypothetical protein